jgi:hypothetical protein
MDTDRTFSEPLVVQRAATPYVGVRRLVTMRTVADASLAIPDVIASVRERGAEPAGPPFVRCHVIDMERELDVETCVPVAQDSSLATATLPGGRYVVAVHHGHPTGLVDAVGRLFEWAADRDLVFDAHDTPAGSVWGGRTETLLTDPVTEPDLDAWDTEIAFRLAD